MTYVVDPADANTPTDNQGAKQGAEELRALKAVVNSIVFSAAVTSHVRNAVIGALNATFLAAGTGLAVSVPVGAFPFISFAVGFGGFGDSNRIQGISSGIDFWTGLAASNTTFLGTIFNGATGVYLPTPTKTLIPPQYGQSFDRTRGALLNFEGADASTTILDDYGNTWTAAGNAQIDTAQFKFGNSSLLFDGTGDYIGTPDILRLGVDSWELSAWFRINALPGAAARTVLFAFTNAGGFGVNVQLFNNAGTTKLEISLSSDSTTNNIANASVGTNTVWTLAQWNKIRVVFDALAGTYRIYLSLNGAIETQDFTVSSAARICALTQNRIGATVAGASGWNGWIDAFRFLSCATVTGIETPAIIAPVITDYDQYWYDQNFGQMKQITAAAVAAGSDPTLGYAIVVFIGEADTNGAAVTAVRPYAINGRAEVSQSGLALSTAYTLNHNVGTRFVTVDRYLECLTEELGYKVGDRIHAVGENANSANGYGVFTSVNRNTLTLDIGAGAIYAGVSKTAPGAVVGFTTAFWKYIAIVRRNF